MNKNIDKKIKNNYQLRKPIDYGIFGYTKYSYGFYDAMH